MLLNLFIYDVQDRGLSNYVKNIRLYKVQCTKLDTGYIFPFSSIWQNAAQHKIFEKKIYRQVSNISRALVGN